MAAAAVAMAAAGPAGVTVTVDVGNVRNDKGHVLAAVCTRNEFLSPTCAFVGSAPAHAGNTTVRIEGVPPGRYAIQVFHDENDNRKIDRSFLGVPREGMGFSNDAPFRFGPPAYADAQVAIGPGAAAFAIRLRYF